MGDVEDGVVTGVTNVGVFVQVRRYLIDGLIRFRDLPDDWWDINSQGGYVVGQQSGRRIAIGDSLRIQIAGVDIAARELDLALPADAFSSQRGAGGGKAAKSSRRAAAKPKRQAAGKAAHRGKTAKRSQGRRPRRR